MLQYPQVHHLLLRTSKGYCEYVKVKWQADRVKLLVEDLGTVRR